MDVIEIERQNEFIIVDKTKDERLEILVSQGQKGDKGDPGDISSVKVNGVELEKVGGSVNVLVPTKTSDLTNDSDFQNENEVNALIADALSDFTSLKYEIVQQLPQVGENGVIYLIANSGTSPNIYDEYIYINGSFEKMGTTEVDLSQYYTKTETDDLLDDKADTSDLSSVATSGSYNDLSDKPTIPTKTSDLTNDSGYVTRVGSEVYVGNTQPTDPNIDVWIDTNGQPTPVATQSSDGLMSSSDKTKLDNGEVYSTSETKVGTWIDGKPIYRKVVQGSLTLSPQTWVDTDIVDSTIDLLINAKSFYAGSNTAVLEINANRTSDGKIQVLSTLSTTTYPTAILLEYTKTTD